MTAPERGNIFGTDGIRDRHGSGFLTDESLDRLAIALAGFAKRGRLQRGRAREPRVLFGRDSRVSGPSIAARLASGLIRGKCQVLEAGVVPTPAVSLLVAEDGFDLGIVISASHNPPDFNGIKVFDRWGRKLGVSDEEFISDSYRSAIAPEHSELAAIPSPVEGSQNFQERYLNILLASFGD